MGMIYISMDHVQMGEQQISPQRSEDSKSRGTLDSRQLDSNSTQMKSVLQFEALSEMYALQGQRLNLDCIDSFWLLIVATASTYLFPRPRER